MKSLVPVVVTTILFPFYSCAVQDVETAVLYETPVFKATFEDGFMVKVYSLDDVLDGVENKASQVAEFTLPLDAIPGAKLVATAMVEWNVTGGNDCDNLRYPAHVRDRTGHDHDKAVASARVNQTTTAETTRNDTAHGSVSIDFSMERNQSVQEQDDKQVKGAFDDDVDTELEKEISKPYRQHEPLFSNEQLARLSKKVQEEVDMYVKELQKANIQGPARNSRNSTIDMQTTSSFTIEALFVADYSIYLQFLARALYNPFVAMENLKAYYSNIVLATNTRLATAAAGATGAFTLTLSLSAIIIAETAEASPWTESFRDANLNINPLLPSTTFNVFAAGLNAAFPHDVAVLFTGYTIVTAGGEVPGFTSGPSFLCSLIGNIWITDNRDERTSLYLARYVGDSLGIQRDGPNGCSESALNIMSSLTLLPTTAATASNPWAFSSCSASELRMQLPSNAFTCTTSLQNSAPFNTGLYTTQAFGQRFDADEQCRNLRRPDSRFCREVYYAQAPPFSVLCYNLQCANVNGQCEQTIAHDGTSCGDRSFCQQGVCVSSPLAPFRPTNCPQLDNPRTTCTLASCANPVLAFGDCCFTCNNILQPHRCSKSINCLISQ